MLDSPAEFDPASDELADWVMPAGHSDDPFACPCCANVFSELLRIQRVDVAAHGRKLRQHEPLPGGTALWVNANILTMNPQQPTADAIYFEDGKISWLGSSDDLPEVAEHVQRFDAQGQFLMPGFVEPHMHLAPLAMLHDFINVGPFRFESMDDALACLSDAAKQIPDGDWVVGRQFDPSLQRGGERLTCDLLDEVSDSHPIFIYNASLHLAYCNGVALKLAGVDQDTPDPQGAAIGRFADGRPNGVLKGGPAMALVARYNPVLKQQNLAEGCLQVLAQANRVGITTLCDQGTGLFQGAKELELYQSLRDSGRMTARFRYSLSQAAAEKWDAIGASWGEGDAWVRNTGWKIVSDGSNQGRTGLQREPFLDTQDTGIAYIEEDELNHAVEKRLREGWAVCVHANGDAAIDRVLNAYERADELGLAPGQRRCRIEHCSVLHDEQIERLAQLGISPSFLIGHVYYWGAAFVDDIFGLQKASKLGRAGSCESRDIRWTIHSDDPVTEMNPLRCIENAVTRTMWRAEEQLAPQEAVSVDAALRATTIDSAWQCHSDHEVGSLEVGKYADFIVLQEDPRKLPAHTLSQVEVLQTWVDGRCVYRNADVQD